MRGKLVHRFNLAAVERAQPAPKALPPAPAPDVAPPVIFPAAPRDAGLARTTVAAAASSPETTRAVAASAASAAEMPAPPPAEIIAVETVEAIGLTAASRPSAPDAAPAHVAVLDPGIAETLPEPERAPAAPMHRPDPAALRILERATAKKGEGAPAKEAERLAALQADVLSLTVPAIEHPQPDAGMVHPLAPSGDNLRATSPPVATDALDVASVDPAPAVGITGVGAAVIIPAVRVPMAEPTAGTPLEPVSSAALDPTEGPLIAALEEPEDKAPEPKRKAQPSSGKATLARPAAPGRTPPAPAPLPRRPVADGHPSPSVTTLGAPDRRDAVIVTLPAPRYRVETLGGRGRTSPNVQVLGE
jgi:hypothetical protein